MSWIGFARSRLAAPARREVPPVEAATAASLKARMDAAAQPRLGRSLAVLHVDAGSCGGCEIELRAVRRAVYDAERFGVRFVDTPRHADILLVTGPVTRNMVEALERAHAAMPEPKFVVAVGDCAVDGGVFKGSYAVTGGAGTTVPVDLQISGCPPTPARIVAGLRALLEANARARAAVSRR
jgi:Ni,Fe-hydrogenase III small subunit